VVRWGRPPGSQGQHTHQGVPFPKPRQGFLKKIPDPRNGGAEPLCAFAAKARPQIPSVSHGSIQACRRGMAPGQLPRIPR
jgi:hypothetical protein